MNCLVEAVMKDENRYSYTCKLEYYSFGLDWGKRGKIFKRFTYKFRIGVWYPQCTLFTIAQPPVFLLQSINFNGVYVCKLLILTPGHSEWACGQLFLTNSWWTADTATLL
jgi:hypothetical protein